MPRYEEKDISTLSDTMLLRITTYMYEEHPTNRKYFGKDCQMSHVNTRTIR